MTVLDAPTALPQIDEPQLLFQEARERRRRRRIRAGIVAGVVVVLLALVAGTVFATGGRGSSRPTTPTQAAPVAGRAAETLSFRPVLCFAPPYAPAAGVSTASGPLPTCAAGSQLTAANLGVDTSTGQATGTPPADVRFAGYPSTPSGTVRTGDTVLLPGTSGSGEGSERFVLGPAALTQQDISSARVLRTANGVWAVDLTLSPAGSARWDALVQQQFHALVGIVLDGQVISVPLTEPVQSSFTSFDGQVQIAGNFTGAQAKAVAAGL